MSDHKNEMVQELFEGLRVNLKLTQDILKVLEDEGKALVDMDTQRLFRLSKEKSNLLAKIQFIDDSLTKTLSKLGAENNDQKNVQYGSFALPSVNKLSGLSHLLPKSTLIELNKYKLKIVRLRQEIQDRNLVNKKFTEDTLGYLSDAVSLITAPAQEKITYSSSAMPPFKSRLPSLISKEV